VLFPISADRFSISFINGYRVIPQFAFGIGIGVRMFFYKYINGGAATNEIDICMPFYLHLRSDFLAKKVSPYIAFNIGYNVGLSGGLFPWGIVIEPSFGISFNLVDKSRMNIGLVFPVNRVNYRLYDGTSYNYNYYRGKAMGGAINLKVGISF
jgi:hypothetical protein